MRKGDQWHENFKESEPSEKRFEYQGWSDKKGGGCQGDFKNAGG